MAITQVRPSVSNKIRIATKSSATTMFIGGSGTGDEAIQAGDLVIVHGMQKGSITADNASCQINNTLGTYLTPMPNGGTATTSGNAIVRTFNNRYHMAWFRVLTSSDISSGLLTLYWTNGGGIDVRGNFALSVFRGVDTSNIMVNGTPSSSQIKPINSVTFSTVVDSANNNDTFTWASWNTNYNTNVTNTGNYPGEVTAFAIGSCDRGNFNDNTFTGGQDATQQLASDNVTVNPIGEYHGAGVSTLQLIRSFASLSDATTGTNNLATPWSVTSTGSGDNHRDCTFWFLLPAAATATDHVETITDSASATDTLSVIHGVAQTSTETDASTVTDTLSAIHGVARTSTETDSATTTDTLSAIHGVSHAFTATDASTTTDTLTVLETGTAHTFARTDSSSVSDSLTTVETGTDHTFSQTDSATANDTLTVLETGTAHTFTRTDSASSTDLLTVVETGTDHTFSRTDSASTSDVLTATETAGGTPHTFGETDSASASDSLATVETGTDHTFSQTDSATASDSLTVVETGTAHTFSQTDSATSADLLTRGHGRLFSETDSASVTDSLSVVETGTNHTFSKTDSVSASDSLTATEAGVANTFNETDSASATDSLTTLETGTSHTFGETDSASVVDSLTTQEVGTQHTFGETDTSSVADTLTTQHDAVFIATDQSTVADTLATSTQGQSFFNETDSVSVEDTLEVVRSTSHTFSETDSTTTNDSLITTETGTAHVFSETDSASTSDLLSSVAQRVAEFIDSALVSETLVSGKQQFFNVTDTNSASDELTVFKSSFFVVTDSTETNDSLLIVSGQVVEITDSATSGDTLIADGPVVKEAEITLFGLGGLDFTLLTEDQAMSVLNVWNTALTSLGITTIKSTDEGSPQQVLLSNVFPLFKQQFLADHVWNGAKKTKQLSALTDNAGAVVAPVSRWTHAYLMPTDAIRIWRLNGLENQPNYVGGMAINLWEVESIVTDEGTENEDTRRCLCTNEGIAKVEYVFDVPDGKIGSLLSPLVKHAMGRSLAVYVAQNFGKNSTEIAQFEALAKEAVLSAKGVDGQEGTPQIMSNTSLLGVRYI